MAYTQVASAGLAVPAPSVDMVGGRLTLESGVAVSTTDQSAKTTLYYTPHVSNLISLYDGSSTWTTVTFAELSITLASLTASKPYDVFCYNNAGTATLELLVWTNTTTRATALVKQDGRWVKTGATTRRYLGTIYINASGGQSDDSYAKRYVWNAYNRVSRPMRVLESTASWTGSSPSWHQARSTATNQLDCVIGLPDVMVSARVTSSGGFDVSGAAGMGTGIGLDATNALATGALASWNKVQGYNSIPMYATLDTYPGIGRHTITWLEIGDGATTTWYGAGSYYQSGIEGAIEG